MTVTNEETPLTVAATNEETPLLVRREPPLGWVIINRPAARNALTAVMWDELAALIQALVADEQVRVIILRGAGEQSFVSGADIGDLQAQLANPALGEESYRFTSALLNTIAAAPKPVVAMINGHCLGGGILLALACDLRFASDRANFGIPAIKLGVAYPPEQGVTRLVQAIGLTPAADLLLAGRTLDAHEAGRIGLVNRVWPAAELEAATREYAMGVAAGAPLALAAHKLALQQMAQHGHTDQSAEAAALQCYRSADCREGLAAFLAKRPPIFTGK